MGNTYHHQPRKNPSWLWLLLGLGVVIWLLQPQVEEPSVQVPTGTHYTRALPEIQRVEVQVDRPETIVRAYLTGGGVKSEPCCEVTFTHTAKYETGNDSWLSIEALLDDEVTITTTLTYGYTVSLDLANASLGNIKEETDEWSTKKTPRRYIQLYLPEPVVQAPTLLRVETQYPETEIQDALEWIKTHGATEQEQRRQALTNQATGDARNQFELTQQIQSWAALYRAFPTECQQAQRRMENRVAEGIEDLFPQDDIRGFTTVLPQ